MAIQRWNIDPSHSGVHFSVRHMVISKVRGSFDRFSGFIELDEANPGAPKVSVRIEAASIDTRESKRDEHLRSADFLDVEKHPAITFESTRVEAVSGDRLRTTGDLTIHGVKREVVLDTERLGSAKEPWGNQRIAFQGETTINRKDFGLGWNQVLEAGGVLVGEKVEISLDVQAVRT